jgi:glycosyltransferase involved in cell wall biosynthesis/GT2 family glycosyltransferase
MSKGASTAVGRVLLVSDVTGHGGTTKYLQQQASAARVAGWVCNTLLDCGPGTDQVARGLVDVGASVIRKPLYHGNYSESDIADSMRIALHGLRPDIIHFTCGSIRSCIVPREVAIDQSIPFISTEQYLSRLTEVDNDRLLRLRRIHEGAFAVIAVSHENRVLLRRHWGIKSRHLTVVPNAVELPEEFGRPPTRQPRRIVTVTRLTHQKGVDVLLQAMGQLRNLETHLTVIGDGELRNQFEMMARELALDKIQFTGWSDRAAQHLDEYDLFVLPSRAEGQPFALIEALVQGLPCIATAVSGNPEVLGDGIYGDLVAPDSPGELAAAMIDFLKRPDRLRNMSANSESHLRAYHDIDANMARVLAIWDAAKRKGDSAEPSPTESPGLKLEAINVGRSPRMLLAVVSTNDGYWLPDCFASLEESSFQDFDLLLIDNCCDDDTTGVAAESSLPIRCVSVRKRLSFAEANNVAFRVALSSRYRYVMLLNPDTRVHNDALQKLVDFMDFSHDFGIAGSWQATYGDETWSQPNDWTTQVLRGFQDHRHQETHDGPFIVFESDYVQGAAFLVRTALLKQIGFLDPVYGTFYEETDLCRRCRLVGHRVGVLIESRVQHQGGGHWRQSAAANRWRDRLYLRNQLLYKLSEPDIPSWAIQRTWEVVIGQIHSICNRKEDLVLPMHQYPGVLVSFLQQMRHLRSLRLRNRLILDRTDVPESLLSIGNSPHA